MEQRVGETLGRMKESAGDVGAAVRRRRRQLIDRVRHFVHDRPLPAVGVALGVGYVLGGGLLSRTTSRLLAVGVRLSAVAIARKLFADLEGIEPF